MKKVLSFVAIAAMTAFVASSCGDDGAKAKADSAHMADSMKMIADAAQAKMDSAHNADSMKAAADMAMQQHIADSTHMADSLAGAKKGGKPKTPEQKVHEENKAATGGRGH